MTPFSWALRLLLGALIGLYVQWAPDLNAPVQTIRTVTIVTTKAEAALGIFCKGPSVTKFLEVER